jgi:hypothetical protein
MATVHARTRMRLLVVAALGASLSGCVSAPGPAGSRPVRGLSGMVPPSIETPEIARRPAPASDLSALPMGARASLPSHDMGRIFLRLPPLPAQTVSSTDVATSVIIPLLKAMGFARAIQQLRPPPAEGLPQTRPRLAGMAQLLAAESPSGNRAPPTHTRDMVDAFLGLKPPTEDVERRLTIARGLTFAQFRADLERQEIVYPFLQVDGDVPIEHTLLLASRWEGQTVTSVRGTLIHRYSIVNARPLDDHGAVTRAYDALQAVGGVARVHRERVLDGPWLVLLPYGNDPSGDIALLYAWRMVLEAEIDGHPVPFRLWSEATTGAILKMRPLVSDVAALGNVWRRDPGTGVITSRRFEVDPASQEQYTLQLAGLASRLDYLGDGFDHRDAAIPSSTGGSTDVLANFDQWPLHDGGAAVCAHGGNPAFQQIHLFAQLHLNWSQALAAGIYAPFPVTPWRPQVESGSAGCGAWSEMDFGACRGYYEASCPNYSTGDDGASNAMNFAHDSTVIGHEVAHHAVRRFTDDRPSDWCGMPQCSIPLGWHAFHDLADAWADHIDNTNCTGGWVAKNLGGVNASHNCQGARGHVEDLGLPRLHEVTVPFNPASPADHFPEHRDLAMGHLPDMQMPAAILWQVREAVRGKDPVSGHPQYFARLTRALKNTGFLGAGGTTDLALYHVLHDLAVELIEQWATPGAAGGPAGFVHDGNHTTNKVVAGFAKGGVFPIPAICIDGDSATSDAGTCPLGEHGGEAVIDIDDNDLGDDLTEDGIAHPETDFLKLGGPAPTFHVWTGPRYRFSGTKARPITGMAPCHTRFIVEVANDPAFPSNTTVGSGWITVDTDTTTPESPECYGTWTPTDVQWAQLQAGGANTRVYYRTRTRDATDGNERVSTEPGGGLWRVLPPYAVITLTGTPAY